MADLNYSYTKKSGSESDLERIKKNISTSYTYFKENYNRYNDFRNFVFNTSISQAQKTILAGLKKPQIEFNILEAYISRLLGEFIKHEPSITVTPAEGVPVPPEVVDVIEDYIRHVIYEADKNSMSYEVYKDILSGGFSVIKVWTEYASSMSLKQVIKTARCFDPTLCGFDPMARYSHKGDGNYSFEIFPMTENDFKREYPEVSTQDLKFITNLEEFTWSYKTDDNQKIVIVCDYYEKKKKKKQIVELTDGTVMTVKSYKLMQQYWIDNNVIAQIPQILKKRWTTLETICCYKLIENQILEYEETDYSYLPHIFVDGNSILLRQGQDNCMYQMTRPYIYHAKGVQNLKNFAGQCLGNYLENMVQHKFIIKKEAIPQEKDYLEALTNIQQANTVVVNAYSENNPDKPINEPIREVQNVPAPPEVMASFQITDPTTQTILGSYASNLGKNDNDLSGKAVIESASVGNAASMPYLQGFLAAWTQLGNVIADLVPKYLKGKRELPGLKTNGERVFNKINQPNAPYVDYQENALIVNIEAGVNFQVQKNQALQQMTTLMAVSQEFNAFMNSPQGLKILVKNMTIYGADELQEAVPQYLEQQAQQQQQQQEMAQQAMQNDPNLIKAQADMLNAQTKANQTQIDNQVNIAKLSIDDKLADARVMEAESKITQSQIDSAVRLEEANTSRIDHSLDAATKMAEINSREHEQEMNHHENIRQHVKLAHEIAQAAKKGKESGENDENM